MTITKQDSKKEIETDNEKVGAYEIFFKYLSWFLKQNPDIIVTRSDKGNNTVIMKKDEYLKEMEKLLEDTNTYSLLNKDPTNKFEKMANNLITKLQNESIISEGMGKNLRSYNAVPPKLYGLRKTHKKECNMRPVVSSIGMLPFPVPFLKVYVDDVVTAIPKDRMDQTLKTLNSVNNRIQFTMEVENNGTLPFLDMNIIRNEDGSIVTNWYVKPTSSGRCINYNSNHPMSQKIGVVKGLLYRALTLRQTKQKLKKRLEQHRNDSKPKNAQKTNTTALAEHHFKTGHNFKFDETKILDKEDNWFRLLLDRQLTTHQ
ncbi:hypothetical protein M0804_007539 [Polistes exclamans]|nr:hypothetical protein M0804_007539 [Polistes exclamans]